MSGANQSPLSTSSTVIGTVPSSDSDSPAGPPRTVNKVVALLVAVLSVFSTLFAIWDHSDFPQETLTHPWYWIGVAVLFAAALILALFVCRANWWDGFLIFGLLLGTVYTSAKVVLIAREQVPSDRLFTVTVFEFGGDDRSTRDTAGQFRGAVLDELSRNKMFASGFRVVPRNRPINDDTEDEKFTQMRKWSRRKEKGGHLAIWMRLGWDGTSYSVTGMYADVYPLGTETQPDMGFGKQKFNDVYNYKAQPTGEKRSLGPDEVQRVLLTIRYYWGVASYQKGDPATALQLLRNIGTQRAEALAGVAAIDETDRLQAKNLAEEAVSHLQKAISLTSEENYGLKGSYYENLGIAHKLLCELEGKQGEAKESIAALDKSIDLYAKANQSGDAAQAKVRKADSLYDLYELEIGTTADDDLDRAKEVLKDALSHLNAGTWIHAHAMYLQGKIALDDARRETGSDAESDYEDSVTNLDRASRMWRDLREEHDEALALVFLGEARARNGIIQSKEGVFQQGIETLQESLRLCRSRWPEIRHTAEQAVGDVETEWSKTRRLGSLDWGSALDRAEGAYQHAQEFIPEWKKPRASVEIERDLATVYTMRALGEKELSRKDNCEKFLRVALGHLDSAIQILNDAHPQSIGLHEDRAECYRRLHECSAHPDRNYLELWRQEKELVRTQSAHQ